MLKRDIPGRVSFWGMIIFSLILVRCSQPRPMPMDENTFARTLGELMVIQRLSVPDSVKAVLIRNVFKEQRITESDFLSIKTGYKEDELFWQRIYRKPRRHIREMEKAVQTSRLEKTKISKPGP